jgi:GDPmannose 4,6-dehydratase
LRILITGAAGQDGKNLGKELINANHQVVMVCRPESSKDLQKEFPSAEVFGCDLTDFQHLGEILRRNFPDTIVNLAAFSSVKDSWSQPEILNRINFELPKFLIEWIYKLNPDVNFLQASSSEIFGSVSEEPQTEMTALRPLTPYGYSKAKAHQFGCDFRERYKLNISNIILYNHESLNRSTKYVTRHVSEGISLIFLGKSNVLKIGNLKARRDWGWAPDYMSGLRMLIEKKFSSDFIFATGQTHSVEKLIEIGFETIGISDFQKYIELTQEELRMADPMNLRGDATKAREILGWTASYTIHDFMPLMVANDIKLNQKEEN